MIKYRIEYSIQRATDESGEFVEIGFGSSGSWGRIKDAEYEASSAIERAEWETTGDMPDPKTVDTEEPQ